jgi:argininosuccinate synthase
MLEFDTAKRATAAHMLTHPWLEVQKNKKYKKKENTAKRATAAHMLTHPWLEVQKRKMHVSSSPYDMQVSSSSYAHTPLA